MFRALSLLPESLIIWVLTIAISGDMMRDLIFMQPLWYSRERLAVTTWGSEMT